MDGEAGFQFELGLGNGVGFVVQSASGNAVHILAETLFASEEHP